MSCDKFASQKHHKKRQTTNDNRQRQQQKLSISQGKKQGIKSWDDTTLNALHLLPAWKHFVSLNGQRSRH